jgi:cytochrome c biogenesis protein CcmG/thiol:disulfide interchange protein DsbE
MPVRDYRAAAAVAAFWVAFGATPWGGSGAAWAVAPGEAAPTFALPTADAGPVSLEALRGRVVYVDFWASWCGPCRRSFPFMNELKERYGERGLTVVAVNVDAKREDAARFLRQYPATFAVVYDPTGATPRAYEVKAMPSSYLVDRSGRVVAIEHGFLEERRAPVEERIRALLAER